MKELKLPHNFRTIPILKTVSDFLAGSGINSYLVGGALRDMVLGRDTVDLDIAVEG